MLILLEAVIRLPTILSVLYKLVNHPSIGVHIILHNDNNNQTNVLYFWYTRIKYICSHKVNESHCSGCRNNLFPSGCHSLAASFPTILLLWIGLLWQHACALYLSCPHWCISISSPHVLHFFLNTWLIADSCPSGTRHARVVFRCVNGSNDIDICMYYI